MPSHSSCSSVTNGGPPSASSSADCAGGYYIGRYNIKDQRIYALEGNHCASGYSPTGAIAASSAGYDTGTLRHGQCLVVCCIRDSARS